MVGPNPYPVNSFLELRKIVGPAWVVCRPCRRFVPVGRWLDRRDTRVTTFSCSVCGGAGTLVLEDPAADGLQHDPRRRPLRHPLAAARLRAVLPPGGRFGHRAPPRELRPPRHKPPLVPVPRYRLTPMPFTRFGQLPGLGLALEVWCSSCKVCRPVAVDGRLAPHRFGRVRFTCSGTGYDGTPCRGLGHPQVRPAQPIDRGRPSVSLGCGGCLPPWSAIDVQLDRPPWTSAPFDPRTERWRCPGCDGQVGTTFHDNPARR